MKCFFSSATRMPSAEDGPRFHRVSMTRCSRLLRFFLPPNIVALQTVVDNPMDVKIKNGTYGIVRVHRTRVEGNGPRYLPQKHGKIRNRTIANLKSETRNIKLDLRPTGATCPI